MRMGKQGVDRTWAGLCFGMVLACAAAGADELPLLVRADFDQGDLSAWKMTDAKAWRLIDSAGGKALALVAQSKYSPKVRSPINYALLNDVGVTDFVLECKLRSTARDYGHRDLCLFFGHQDAEHFYYIHLGRNADPAAHSVFLVNGKPRVSIAKERTKGTPWTNDWHRVRLERNVATGDIKVFFDDGEKPIMHAVDKTFTHGKIGVGSFDDTGVFDDILLRGIRAPKP